MVIEEKIRELAYQLWEKDGYPEGKDTEHYYTAKRILEEQESAPHRQNSAASPSRSAVAPSRPPISPPAQGRTPPRTRSKSK